jgi:uncharacterized protein (UPF0147 family)
MTNPVQTVMTHSVPREERQAAIETLTEAGRTTDLAALIRVDGLPGGLRRQAVDGLRSCEAGDLLEELADDRSIPPELRKKAQR